MGICSSKNAIDLKEAKVVVKPVMMKIPLSSALEKASKIDLFNVKPLTTQVNKPSLS